MYAYSKCVYNKFLDILIVVHSSNIEILHFDDFRFLKWNEMIISMVMKYIMVETRFLYPKPKWVSKNQPFLLKSAQTSQKLIFLSKHRHFSIKLYVPHLLMIKRILDLLLQGLLSKIYTFFCKNGWFSQNAHYLQSDMNLILTIQTPWMTFLKKKHLRNREAG